MIELGRYNEYIYEDEWGSKFEDIIFISHARTSYLPTYSLSSPF